MIARLANLFFATPEAHDRTVRAIAEVALPLVQEAAGFVNGCLLGEEGVGRAVLITLWRDQETHDAAISSMEKAMAAIAQAGATIEGPVYAFPTVLVADARGVRRTPGGL